MKGGEANYGQIKLMDGMSLCIFQILSSLNLQHVGIIHDSQFLEKRINVPSYNKTRRINAKAKEFLLRQVYAMLDTLI